VSWIGESSKGAAESHRVARTSPLWLRDQRPQRRWRHQRLPVVSDKPPGLFACRALRGSFLGMCHLNHSASSLLPVLVSLPIRSVLAEILDKVSFHKLLYQRLMYSIPSLLLTAFREPLRGVSPTTGAASFSPSPLAAHHNRGQAWFFLTLNVFIGLRLTVDSETTF